MRKPYIKWNDELIQLEANKYNTRQEFRTSNYAAYQAALGRDINKFCNHMTPLLTDWTYEMIHIEALKYNTRSEFQYNNKNAYCKALNMKIIDDVCSHMVSGINVLWDEVTLAKIALEYNTKADFSRGNFNAYNAAKAKKLLNKLCTHMVTAKGGFDPTKPTIKYYIKFFANDEIPLYKIGITNRKTKLRKNGMLVNKSYSSVILHEEYYEIGQDALNLERFQKEQFKEFKYNGEPIMKNGNTELFIIDVLGLDIQPQIKHEGTSKEVLSSSSAA